jgi:hypothetical protein
VGHQPVCPGRDGSRLDFVFGIVGVPDEMKFMTKTGITASQRLQRRIGIDDDGICPGHDASLEESIIQAAVNAGTERVADERVPEIRDPADTMTPFEPERGNVCRYRRRR